jgi:hypothetical protein
MTLRLFKSLFSFRSLFFSATGWLHVLSLQSELPNDGEGLRKLKGMLRTKLRQKAIRIFWFFRLWAIGEHYMRYLIILPIAFVVFTAQAQDRCGIPLSVHRSGFESGEQPSSAVLPVESTPITVQLDTPTNNATTGVSSIFVTGTYTGPATTGLSVNDVPMLTDGSRFISMRVPLAQGANTLSFKYASLDNAPVSLTRTVTYDPAQAPSVLLTSGAPGEHAPVVMPFYLTTTLPAGQSTVTRVQIDYNGDGTFDVDAAQPLPLYYPYETAGQYLARARVSFDDGSSVTPLVVLESTTPVLIQNLAVTRQTLCGIYYAMKNRLIANNPGTAANALMPAIQSRFQGVWMQLAQSNALVTAGTRLGEIVDGQIARNAAEFEVAIPTDVAGSFRGYRVQFRKDTNGVWRIRSM